MPEFSNSKEFHLSLQRAQLFATQRGENFLMPEHLLVGLIDDPTVIPLLQAFQIKPSELKQKLIEELDIVLRHNDTRAPSYGERNLMLTPQAASVIARGKQYAASGNRSELEGIFVLVGILGLEESTAAVVLNEFDLDQFAVKRWISHKTVGNTATAGADNAASASTPNALEQFAINLNQKAIDKKIDPLIGRTHEVERTVQILCRRRKNNPLLVGDPGVGKTAIAEGLAHRIVEGQVPEVLADSVIYLVDMGAMIAGTKYRGDFENRVNALIKQAEENPKIILFIDEIHTVIGAGSASGGTMDAGNLLKPALSAGRLRLIGSTTFREYREVFEKDQALVRRFQKIDVNEPTPNETVAILEGLKTRFEEHHDVTYTPEALSAAVSLSVRYIPSRLLPDKAIDLIDEAGAHQRILPAEQRVKVVGEAEIEATVARITQIPVTEVSSTDRESLANLESGLQSVIYGQDKAIAALSNAIQLSRAGLREGDRPVGSFLFTGPTGVGKTEVTRQLATQMGIKLVRFDMSEYMEAHAVSRLIGAPPGYVGHDKGGLLTEAITKTPYCVLLLDEIEKAHPDIYNILLQVMDRGTLTDTSGRSVDFKNVILVLTTNVGAAHASRRTLGFVQQNNTSDAMEVLNRTFSPEFRNRLDGIVQFQPLGQDHILQVVNKNLFSLSLLLSTKCVTLDIGPGVREWLAEKGFDPQMGARPMARLIEEKIKQPLAACLLFGSLKDGGAARVELDGEGGLKVWGEGVPSERACEETAEV